MAFAIRVYQLGGPEKLIWEDLGAVPKPDPEQILVRNKAIGLNFLDVYFRSGSYPLDTLPFTPGAEGAGVVEAIGSAVKNIRVGDRVGYVEPLGAYAEYTLINAARAIKIPDYIDDKTAAAIMLKGMTAEYLLKRTYKVKAGDTVLIHAAMGGVGQIMCQWATHLGAKVMGIVSNDNKATQATQNGCDHVIVANKSPFAQTVLDITHNRGVQVVYDGVGKDTFIESLACLAPLGMMVSFGSASGKIESFSLDLLSKGSLFLTRPTLFAYIASREDLEHSANEIFSAVKQGIIKVAINQTYELQDVAQAHRDLESRKTTGTTLLLPPG